jgi:hypothetical protein
MAIIGSQLSFTEIERRKQLAANYRHVITPPYRFGPGQLGRIPIVAYLSMISGEMPLPGKCYSCRTKQLGY